jgi:hypothetical protein
MASASVLPALAASTASHLVRRWPCGSGHAALVSSSSCRPLMLPAAATRSVCDSLSDGANRHQRKAGELCECNEGWGGINCNSKVPSCFEWSERNPVVDVTNFPRRSLPDRSGVRQLPTPWLGELICRRRRRCDPGRQHDVLQGRRRRRPKLSDVRRHQYVPGFRGSRPATLVTVAHRPEPPAPRSLDPAIIRELGKKKPQVTFSCSAGPAASNQGTLGRSTAAADGDDDAELGKTCAFQFWIEKVESFYCALSECDWQTRSTYDANVTEYSCQKIQCDCVPGRMLCGEDGSVSEWLASGLSPVPCLLFLL